MFLWQGSSRNDIYRNTVIGDSNVGFPGPSERGIMAHCETGACNDNRIRDNSVTNVFNGIQLTNNVHGNVVDHNESFGNGRGFRQFSDDPSTMPTDSSVVRHNKFHDNSEQGISSATRAATRSITTRRTTTRSTASAWATELAGISSMRTLLMATV